MFPQTKEENIVLPIGIAPKIDIIIMSRSGELYTFTRPYGIVFLILDLTI